MDAGVAFSIGQKKADTDCVKVGGPRATNQPKYDPFTGPCTQVRLTGDEWDKVAVLPGSADVHFLEGKRRRRRWA